MGDLPLFILAGVIVIATVVMLLSRNTITSALSLLVVFFSLACIYALIGAHFVAAMQLIVYAGAIIVLFLFTIMLLNPSTTDKEIHWKSGWPVLGAGVSVALALLLTKAFTTSSGQLTLSGEWTPEKIQEAGGNVVVLSNALFTKYYLPFEIVSVLLLLAIAGAVVLAKRKWD